MTPMLLVRPLPVWRESGGQARGGPKMSGERH